MKHATLALMLLAALGTAHAQAEEENEIQSPDGLIIVTGGVLDQTCRVDSGDQYKLVELPFVGKNSLSQAGDSAGYTPFEIKLTNCSTDSAYFPYLHFQGREIDTMTGNLNNLFGGNVQVQLLNEGQPIALHQPGASQLPDYELSSSEFTLRYGAQYVATAAAEPGPVLSMVDYVIAYK